MSEESKIPNMTLDEATAALSKESKDNWAAEWQGNRVGMKDGEAFIEPLPTLPTLKVTRELGGTAIPVQPLPNPQQQGIQKKYPTQEQTNTPQDKITLLEKSIQPSPVVQALKQAGKLGDEGMGNEHSFQEDVKLSLRAMSFFQQSLDKKLKNFEQQLESIPQAMREVYLENEFTHFPMNQIKRVLRLRGNRNPFTRDGYVEVKSIKQGQQLTLVVHNPFETPKMLYPVSNYTFHFSPVMIPPTTKQFDLPVIAMKGVDRERLNNLTSTGVLGSCVTVNQK